MQKKLLMYEIEFEYRSSYIFPKKVFSISEIGLKRLDERSTSRLSGQCYGDTDVIKEKIKLWEDYSVDEEIFLILHECETEKKLMEKYDLNNPKIGFKNTIKMHVFPLFLMLLVNSIYFKVCEINNFNMPSCVGGLIVGTLITNIISYIYFETLENDDWADYWFFKYVFITMLPPVMFTFLKFMNL